MLDSAHKIISPATYDCKLCELTHGVFKENELWSRFLDRLRFRESLNGMKPVPHSLRYESISKNHPDVQLEFLHKDEFHKKYWSKWLPKYDFPIVLMASEQEMYNDGFGSNSGLDIFINTAEMNALESLEELIAVVEKRIKGFS